MQFTGKFRPKEVARTLELVVHLPTKQLTRPATTSDFQHIPLSKTYPNAAGLIRKMGDCINNGTKVIDIVDEIAELLESLEKLL